MNKKNQELKQEISALWDAVEQLRQALPRCTECDSLIEHKTTDWRDDYCSFVCHQVGNHT